MSAPDDELWAAFKSDADAASDAMEQCLLQLELGGGDAEVLNTLYRALHTWKGVTRMMRLTHIERVAHRAEDLVSAARDQHRPLSAATCDVLLSALDYLRAASNRATAQRRDDSAREADIVLVALDEVAARELRASQPAVHAPPHDPTSAGTITLFSDPPAPPPAEPQRLAGAPVSPAVTAAKPPPQPATVSPAVTAVKPSPQPGPAAGPARGKSDEYVRIQARKIQQLLGLAAEMGLAAHAVTRSPALGRVDDHALHEATHALDRLVRELRDSAATLAFVPISSAFDRMKRVVRDIARDTQKEIGLRIEGEDTELDKTLVDQLGDPLLHLLRNAADHGLETPDERVALGKPRRGNIVLSARQNGAEVIVSISDDGRGLNRERILTLAVARGLVQAGAEPTNDEVWRLIFEPGFSTADRVSNLSGRGVGMDVVRSTVEALQGSTSIKTRAGKGTQISLHLPLSLSFMDGLVVKSGDRAFVFPLGAVSKIYRSTGSELRKVSARGRDIVQVDGELASVCWLNRLYGYRVDRSGELTGRVVVLLHTRRGKLALPIDELLGSHQVTMKPLFGAFRSIRAATACGVLGSGDVAIAVDCERLHDHVV